MPIKTLKKGLFFRSWELIKKKPKNLIFILFFDVLFLIVLIIFERLIRTYLPKDPTSIQNFFLGSNPVLLLILLLFYYLIIIFVHSILKILILRRISDYDKQKANISLKKFFLLNITIFPVSMILFIIIRLILYSIFNPTFFKWVAVIFYVIYIILVYVFINLSHAVFIREKSLKKILKKSLSLTFKGIKKYYGTLLWVLVLAAAYLLFFSIVGNIAKAANIKQELYNVIYTTISFILLYFVVFINRIYFYLISKEC